MDEREERAVDIEVAVKNDLTEVEEAEEMEEGDRLNKPATRPFKFTRWLEEN